jgi:two-component system NarL family sensor kinase
MKRRTAAWILWPIVTLQVVLTISGVLLAALAGWDSSSLTLGFTLDALGQAITILAFPAVGALIFWRRPEHPIGWLFCAANLGWAINHFVGPYAMYALVADPGSLPAGKLAAWFYAWPGYISIGLLLLLLLLFPDGTLLSPRWRLVVWVVIGMAAAGAISSALAAGQIADIGFKINNPLGVEGSLGYVFALLARLLQPLTVVPIAAAALSLGLRQRRARGQERQQIKWFTSSVALVSVLVAAQAALPYGSESAMPVWARVFNEVVIMSFALVPVSAGIAILKYRLYDIDLIIRRTLVYGALSIIVVGLYMLVVASLGALFEAQGQAQQGSLFASLLATGLVAVLFAPLRDRLQRAVNRLMYGHRDDPYEVLSGLGERLEATLAPEAVLPTIVESVAQALKLPYAAITLKSLKRGAEGEPVKVAEYGKKEGAGEPLVVPLGYQQETVGELILSPRSPGESFSNSDLRLLEDLAHQAGVAAHAVRLATELQRSRERLVTAREEERKRLRRDLHDGVGPQLAAFTLKLETARNLLSHDPKTSALMAELSERARATISDVRRSVHALRPPALDELGLVPALREGAAHYNQNGLRISVEAPTSLPPLPAAVEVAAYHIAREAMTNVVRHAGASKCSMRIALDEEADVLHLEVEDDGSGLGEEHKAGVGTHSMRERAEELGGRCTIGAPEGGGNLVSARLPCRTVRDAHRQEE